MCKGCVREEEKKGGEDGGIISHWYHSCLSTKLHGSQGSKSLTSRTLVFPCVNPHNLYDFKSFNWGNCYWVFHILYLSSLASEAVDGERLLSANVQFCIFHSKDAELYCNQQHPLWSRCFSFVIFLNLFPFPSAFVVEWFYHFLHPQWNEIQRDAKFLSRLSSLILQPVTGESSTPPTNYFPPSFLFSKGSGLVSESKPYTEQKMQSRLLTSIHNWILYPKWCKNG